MSGESVHRLCYCVVCSGSLGGVGPADGAGSPSAAPGLKLLLLPNYSADHVNVVVKQ